MSKSFYCEFYVKTNNKKKVWIQIVQLMPTNKETKSNLLNEIKYLVLPKIKINKIKGKLWYTFKGMFGKDDFEEGEKKKSGKLRMSASGV